MKSVSFLYSPNSLFEQYGADTATVVASFPAPVSYLDPAFLGQCAAYTYSTAPGVLIASSWNVLERQAAINVVNAAATLPENWDGFGAASIPEQISNVASGFISSLPVHVPAPEVTANSNGTISLEWENDLGRAHLEIGRTKYSLYFRRSEGQALYRDGVVNEIDQSKKKLLGSMYPVRATSDYTISSVRLRQAA